MPPIAMLLRAARLTRYTMNAMRRCSVAILAIMVGLSACGGDDDSLDFLDSTPEEDADELAAHACRSNRDCNAYIVQCDPPSAMYRTYESDAMCIDDLVEFALPILTGCASAGLTEDEQASLNECFSEPPVCRTEEELSQIASAVCETGMVPDSELSAACEAAADAGDRCAIAFCTENPTHEFCGGTGRVSSAGWSRRPLEARRR